MTSSVYDMNSSTPSGRIAIIVDVMLVDYYDVYIMTVYIMIMIDAVLSNLVSINQSINQNL